MNLAGQGESRESIVKSRAKALWWVVCTGVLCAICAMMVSSNGNFAPASFDKPRPPSSGPVAASPQQSANEYPPSTPTATGIDTQDTYIATPYATTVNPDFEQIPLYGDAVEMQKTVIPQNTVVTGDHGTFRLCEWTISVQYTTSATVADVGAFYDTQMPQLGWSITEKVPGTEEYNRLYDYTYWWPSNVHAGASARIVASSIKGDKTGQAVQGAQSGQTDRTLVSIDSQGQNRRIACECWNECGPPSEMGP